MICVIWVWGILTWPIMRRGRGTTGLCLLAWHTLLVHPIYSLMKKLEPLTSFIKDIKEKGRGKPRPRPRPFYCSSGNLEATCMATKNCEDSSMTRKDLLFLFRIIVVISLFQ